MISAVLLVLAGGAVGCLTLILLLVLATLRFGGSRSRIGGASEPRFRYNSRVHLTWFNTLCACVYPTLIDRDALSSSIKSIFSGIPAGVPSIRRIRLRSFELSPTPPSFNGIALQTSVVRDEVDIDFASALGLTISCSMQLEVPVIGRVSGDVTINVRSLRGCFRVFVPKNRGAMRITIEKRTRIECGFAVGLGGLFTIDTAVIEPVWRSLLNLFHSLIHAKVLTIPLEDALSTGGTTRDQGKGIASGGGGGGGGGRVRFRRYMDLHRFDF
jgi:hypothetical protein